MDASKATDQTIHLWEVSVKQRQHDILASLNLGRTQLSACKLDCVSERLVLSVIYSI